MFTRITSLVVLTAFLHMNFACIMRQQGFEEVQKEVVMSKDQFSGKGKITAVVLHSGETVYFDYNGAKYDKNKDVVIGRDVNGDKKIIAYSDILHVKAYRTELVHTNQKINVVGSLIATIGVLAVATMLLALIIAATKESCPFVYSYNGDNYVFDAEPLGGSVCEGLSKTDFSALEHLKPVNGKYSLLLRNEVEETQYVDQLNLLVIDHPKESKILMDVSGKPHLITKAIGPSKAVNENGKDLMPFVKNEDDVEWQTSLPSDTAAIDQDLRHTLTFTFPKPAGAQSAKLLIKAGTALWGSHMIRRMLEFRGDKVDEWYADINKGGVSMRNLIWFNEREELFFMKLYADVNGTWRQKNYITASGPLIKENRVIPIDLSDVGGETLTLRMHPPKVFWTIDYIAVEYEFSQTPLMKELSPVYGRNQDNENILPSLLSADKKYYEMALRGNLAKIEYDVPAQSAGTDRSVFLKTSGYYTLHLAKDHPEQTDLMMNLYTKQGGIVEYALNEYVKFYKDALAKMQ